MFQEVIPILLVLQELFNIASIENVPAPDTVILWDRVVDLGITEQICDLVINVMHSRETVSRPRIVLKFA